MGLKKLMKNKSALFFVYVFLVLLSFVLPPVTEDKKPIHKLSPTPQAAKTAYVTRVIDGDTVEIEGGQKVRYIGVDSPELHHPTKAVQCFAQEAMEKNRSLVEGKNVRLEKDVSDTDKYGRLLRYVYLEDANATSSSIFVNEYLVDQGYAYAVSFPPDIKFIDRFIKAQEKARQNNRGLWLSCKRQ
ncbi:thermonuclease family protein [Candidatus Roizmanbacteria bacterium]|jgi:micrococcal nuclease|nr:thermonuclease family protein [Candidatus Roizmanbacteria bacterium]